LISLQFGGSFQHRILGSGLMAFSPGDQRANNLEPGTTMMTRSQALTTTLAAAVAGVALPTLRAQAAQPPTAAGPFALPALPYAFDALEPHIDARTMEIHHGRHHAGYVNNLNAALAPHTDLQKKSIEELLRGLGDLPESIQTAVRNNGGGHYNHALFWQIMSAKGGGEPKGALAAAIDRDLGGFPAFKDAFSKAALGQFGSGWAWLSYDRSKKALAVQASPNQDNPLMNTMSQTMHKVMRERYGLPAGALGTDVLPILGVDVWEHAYYLKFQNRRADYVAAFFNVIDWDQVAARYEQAQK
jgi:superoxide dismutase, Fe-Mn family